MRNLFARRPSPAMAVAFVALLAALCGTAVALPGKNTVDSGDLKKRAVKRADIARNAVNGRKVRNGSLTGADTRNDSLTGADVNEGTLGEVPSANTANSATTANSAGSVGGVTFRSFNYQVSNDGPATQILDFGGLTLTASCTLDVLDLTAGSTAADAELGSYSVEADEDGLAPQNTAYDGDFDPGDSVDLVTSDEDEEIGTLRYSRADGSGVQVQFHIHGGNNGAGGDAGSCAVNGVASSF
jgi:hypothetical protein